MRLLLLISISYMMALVFSCSSITIKSDYDPEYDFATFQTYRWASAKEVNPNDALAQDQLIYKRVQNAVDKELKAKGLQLVESDDFDFVVVAHAGVKERTQVHQTGVGGGFYGGWYDPYWGPYGGTTTVSNYEEGTLVIDIVHWEKKELAWRGMGTSILDDIDDPEKVSEYVNIWVGKIMAEFPPKK